MSTGLGLFSSALTFLGWLGIFAAAVLFLAGYSRGRDSVFSKRLATLWRNTAETDLKNLLSRTLAYGHGIVSDQIDRKFINVDTSASFNLFFVGLLFVFIPVAAGINKLNGGSPILFNGYLVILAALGILVFSGQTRSHAWFWQYINGALALFAGVALFIGVPFYVLVSFTDRIMDEKIARAFFLSLLIAPFYYAASYSVMNFIEKMFFTHGYKIKCPPAILFIYQFLAAVPLSFVLVFLAILMGGIADADAVPARTPLMLVASVSLIAFSLPATLSILSVGLRRQRNLGIFAALLSGLIVAMGMSIALVLSSQAVSGTAIVNFVLGLGGEGGEGGMGQRGHVNWLILLPFLPFSGAFGMVVVSFLAKGLITLEATVTGEGNFPDKPFLASSLLAGITGALMIACGNFIAVAG